MKVTRLYTLLTFAALFTFAQAMAQQKKPVKQPAQKSLNAVKSGAKTSAKKPGAKTVKAPAVTSKKVTTLAKSLTDTARGGGKSQAAAPQQKSTLSEEIVVTTTYKPLLADAVKIRRNPDLEDVEPFKAPLTYAALDKTLEQNTDIRQLEPMKMPAEARTEITNNYVKAALGSMKTTFGELYLDNGSDEALQVGGFLKHLAQSGSLNNQTYNKEEAGVFGKSIGEVSALSGRINYTYRGNHFYGFDEYNPPLFLHTDAQHFSTLEGEGELAKNYKDEDNQFIYALKLGGYAFSNAYQASENNIHISGYINQTVNQFYAGLTGSLDFNTVKDSLYSFNNNIIRANPYLKFQGENYKIDAGVNITSEFGFNTRFHIFPAARLEFQVIPNYVRLFVEARGDVNKSSLREFSEINPFTGPNIGIQNSIDQLDISAGLKGMLAPGLGFKASVYRNSVKNMPLFVSNFNFANGYNRFTVIYDNGTARVSGFNGELDYKASDDFDLFGRVEIKDYQMASEAQPWNLPKFKLSAGTTIHINKKININGTLLFRGSTEDRVITSTNQVQQVNLNSFADLSGGIEYKVNNRVSIFGQVNNLLNTNYQTWLYYPNYGFNIFGGASYKF
jgi:hypothetical protein